MFARLKNTFNKLTGGAHFKIPTPIEAKAVLLDLDGTLVDSAPDLVAAANSVRVEMGLPTLDYATVVSFVGKGMEVLVHRTLTGQLNGQADPAQLAKGLSIFKRVYSEINGDQTTLYPGVRAGLEQMLDKGLQLGLVTNKPSQFTEALLLKKSLNNYFDVVVSGDTCAHKKPHPEPFLHACRVLGIHVDQAVAIGDSLNDAQAARAAGLRVLGVPYGYNEGEAATSATLDVDGIVPSLVDAAKIIQTI